MLLKHRMILWIASQNRILTKERMTRLNSSVNNLTCCLCEENEIETQNHLFATYGWILKIMVALPTRSSLYLQQRGLIQKSTMVLKKKMEEIPKGSSCGNSWYYDLSHMVSKEHEDFQEHTYKYEFCYSTDSKGDLGEDIYVTLL